MTGAMNAGLNLSGTYRKATQWMWQITAHLWLTMDGVRQNEW